MSYDFEKIIDRRNTYSTQWDFIADRFDQADLLPFSISDTDFQAPPGVLETLHQIVDHGVFGYSRWNHPDYKGSISSYYQERHQLSVAEEWVVYAPSVLYSIAVLLRELTQVGDGVFVFDPMYDAFIQVVQENQRKLVTVPLLPEDGYQIDFDLFAHQAKKAKVLLLCSPHNPTGKVFSQEELAQIMAICRENDLTIISDEIHSDVILFGNRHFPILSWYNTGDKVVLVSSASKTFNIPGLGGSYALIPDEKLRQAFLHQTKARDFVNSPSIMGIMATMTAYRDCQDYIDGLVKHTEGNLLLLKDCLKEQLPQLDFQLPQATYLAWLDLRPLGFSEETIQEALMAEGKVAIMRGSVYGESGTGFLRMNLGCPKQKAQAGIDGLIKGLRSLVGEE